MAIYHIDDDNGLFYDYTESSANYKITFVFFNPLTGDTGIWNNSVTESLIDAGYGVLVYNMRGQPQSPYAPGTLLDQTLIVDDAVRLIEFINPPNPVFVGLSIGGIYAAWAAVQGVSCSGLVFLNTLRRDGPRLQWINDAVVRMAETGGGELMRDIMSPLIMNEEWQALNRPSFLSSDGYSPIDRESGTYNLLSSARATNWDFPYEQLTVPTLVVTGVQDRVFRDPVDIDEIYARLPDARRIDMQNAGHMIPVEQPQALTTALLEMAERVRNV